MPDIETPVLCCALVKSKGTRCSRAAQKGKDFCGTHLKSKNVIRYDQVLGDSMVETNNIASQTAPLGGGETESNGELPNLCQVTSSLTPSLTPIQNPVPTHDISPTTSLKFTPMLIPIHHRSRIRYQTIKLKDLKKTLDYYRQNTDGKKKDLFNRLLSHFDSLLPFTGYLKQIFQIQQWYRTQLNLKITSIRKDFNYPTDKCVNDNDVLTLVDLDTIPSEYLITYKDIDGFIYGFDLRSLDKLFNHSSGNPYTSKPLPNTCLLQMKNLISYLKIQGLSFQLDDEDDQIELKKYSIKRRVVKVFQDMDKLDQYTNPSWFLDLGINSLNKFYREAEDIWNYRLNLSNEIKNKIVPPNGKVFKIEPKNALKDYPTRDKMRSLCLDIIETLIYSAPERSDRVNGCIYILLALVIVNQDAANAMPSYYTMVTGDVNHANYLEVPI